MTHYSFTESSSPVISFFSHHNINIFIIIVLLLPYSTPTYARQTTSLDDDQYSGAFINVKVQNNNNVNINNNFQQSLQQRQEVRQQEVQQHNNYNNNLQQREEQTHYIKRRESQNNNFNISFVNSTAIYAFASYCRIPYLSGWKCWWCKQVAALDEVEVSYNESTDIQGYVGINKAEQIIYVSFRGTIAESIPNWVSNTQFLFTQLRPNAPARVHLGFLKSYRSISNSILASVKRAINNCSDCKLIITGHSLGGAIAQIAAIDIIDIYTKVTVVTYGAPRVGDTAFSVMFGSLVNDTIRMVHRNDVVTKIPSSVFLGYHHAPMEVWENEGVYTLCNPKEGEDDSCSRSISILSASLTDHFTYVGVNQQDGHGHGCSSGNNTLGMDTFDVRSIKYLY